MKKLLILLTAMMLLSACGAKTEGDAAADQPTNDPTAETATPAADSLSQTTKIQPLATFIELGAESCIPCKMMQPILTELRDEYQGLLKVEFTDLYKDRAAAQKYSVRVMPTQVFLDADGREFFRHEGFYPKAEIEKMLLEKIGIRKPEDNVPQTDTTRP
ncbi:MAG: thioredoxin family protein [Candidatus Cloacimonetes bacterium]|jgi:thioredoxin 1|nr:thioredoxin family protein [Candidatus Cloacimonadota bacterium]MDD3142909.1 thioredoxin family protein [Candidatus Cloacimonadota bacterium]MDY0367850.1 thioredoxin family protein [Candidatus Syntrophosphaera sp.]HOY84554.1 thioredoxin family protein [Candidatus Syntrophosphaera sp.]HPH60164.1 thioredoxin family protein [Candidatus Syntrophosphaera sp.]